MQFHDHLLFTALNNVYLQGCYDAAVEYLTENSSILIGLGIGIGLLLVSAIKNLLFMSIYLFYFPKYLLFILI